MLSCDSSPGRLSQAFHRGGPDPQARRRLLLPEVRAEAPPRWRRAAEGAHPSRPLRHESGRVRAEVHPTDAASHTSGVRLLLAHQRGRGEEEGPQRSGCY